MLDGFETLTRTYRGATRSVYRRGEGPGVLVMHEIPGITPQVAAFARTVADAGFRVELPQLFGTPNKKIAAGYVLGQMARACIRREFLVLASHEASPITEWLRDHARELHEEAGGRGVGAIGMCLTGNFALALMLEPSLMVPVLSQPSLPFPFGKERRAALHISPEQLAAVKKRSREGAGVLGLRFTGDPLCPPERFETLRRELGPGFEAIEIDSGKGNPHGLGRAAHSVVTTELIDEEGHPTREALDRVLALLEERLRP
ncbi:MAG: dienelactone hydrolase [Deltaproteobacteria bacterium]|jgi:dienelactone hydrolase|nr:dienelactone hydrolase [Deltaproteobacteria bacterium]